MATTTSRRILNHLSRRPCILIPTRYALVSIRSYRATTTSEPDVRILEVGPRDGLQNIKPQVATSTKIELIRRLASAGCRAIEATSFVPAKWIPQLADSQEVMKEVLLLATEKSIRLPVLTPNLKGFERAVASGAREAVVFASASEGFSWKNTNCSVEDALARAEQVVKAALAQGLRARGVISCIFACPYDGPTDPTQVLAVAKRFVEMGCYEVGLGDTLGVGTVYDTEKLLRILLSEIPAEKLAGHYHDTYGQAIPNIAKSYEMGLRAFDSSVAGLGGCPYAKGATGNVATEDVVYMFDGAGVSTGIDVKQLADVGDWISRTVSMRNGSRAGAAIVAKGDSGTSVVAASQTTSKSEVVNWKVITDDGEHRVSRAANVVKITLTRSNNGNALTNRMMDSITSLLRTLAKDPSVFHIVLEAEGKFFCTGMDLSASGSTAQNDSKVKEEYYQKVENLFSAVMDAPQTTIAVVQGQAFGGGVGLAFACDVRLVSTQTRFTMTEIKLGLSPATISRHIVRELGIPFAREAMLSGRTLYPEELRSIGAVHGVASSTEELATLAADYLQRLRNCAPRAATAIKELVRRGWTDPGGEEQTKYIKKVFAEMVETGSEGEYGMAQFRKKNKNIDWAQFHAAVGDAGASSRGTGNAPE